MAEATVDTRVPVLSFGSLITNNRSAEVTGRRSDPCLEPTLTTDHAPSQARDNPEFLRTHEYGSVLVPFCEEFTSGE